MRRGLRCFRASGAFRLPSFTVAGLVDVETDPPRAVRLSVRSTLDQVKSGSHRGIAIHVKAGRRRRPHGLVDLTPAVADYSRIRVLHLVAGNMFGGVETMLVTLARLTASVQSMTSVFGVTSEGRLSAELREAGAIVHDLGEVRLRNPRSVLRARTSLASLLREEYFDVVICHSSWPKVVFGRVVRQLELPLVVWQHGPFIGKRMLDRMAIRSAPDLYITNSQFTARTIEKHAAGAQTAILHYPVQLATVDNRSICRDRIRAELGTSATCTVIVQVSRIEPWKGHVLHIRALANLSPDVDWRCWVVGGPQTKAEQNYAESLRVLVRRLGIEDRVDFLGQRSDVASLLNAADVHCQPNTGPEAFGITFVEGLAAGLPVVTTDMGGGVEVVTSSCGIVVPPDDISALTNALETLCRDESLRHRLGRAGPARAAELCDPHRQMRRLQELLSGVAQGKGELHA